MERDEQAGRRHRIAQLLKRLEAFLSGGVDVNKVAEELDAFAREESKRAVRRYRRRCRRRMRLAALRLER